MKKLNDESQREEQKISEPDVVENNVVDDETLELRMNCKVLIKTAPGEIRSVSFKELDEKLGYSKLESQFKRVDISDDEIQKLIQEAVMEYCEKEYGQNVTGSSISKLQNNNDLKNFIDKEYKKALLSNVDVELLGIKCSLRVVDIERIKSCVITIVFGAIWTVLTSVLNLYNNNIMIMIGYFIWLNSLYYSIMLTLSAVDRVLNNQ